MSVPHSVNPPKDLFWPLSLRVSIGCFWILYKWNHTGYTLVSAAPPTHYCICEIRLFC